MVNTAFEDKISLYREPFSQLRSSRLKLFGLEIPLTQSLPVPDAGVCFTGDELPILASWCENMENIVFENSFWSYIKKMIVQKGQLSVFTPGQVWIELDSSQFSGSGSKEPAIFLELPEEARSVKGLINRILPLFINKTPSAQLADTIAVCVDRLPAESEFYYAGYFPARSKSLIRVTCALPECCNIIAVCGRVFQKKIPDETIKLIARLNHLYDFPVLHLDIGNDVVERFGIEFRYSHYEQDLKYQWRIEQFLQFLSGNNICCHNAADELLRFPGTVRSIGHESLIPVWYKRYINYIKGVFSLAGSIHFKAYCGCHRLQGGFN